ncbi:MAG: CoA pyrophosphatase [Labilithrix sp.]|nr:CoA pyrophosphatase [Labilithrix sp.]MCW5833580.1 CoA pyrophosphatase [Labilithrix sp.]
MTRLDAMAAKLAALGGDHGVGSEGPRAAVAAILRELPGADGADLFFIRRADRPTDPWSGHIAFPGGRREPSDASLLATAIRETREEVGIDLSSGRLLGRLPDVPAFLRAKRSGLVVTPFVFALPGDVPVVPNVEVATTLWVPVSTLARGEGKSTFKLDYEGQTFDLPCIHLEPGQHRLWGMTYRMLETLLDAVR